MSKRAELENKLLFANEVSYTFDINEPACEELIATIDLFNEHILWEIYNWQNNTYTPFMSWEKARDYYLRNEKDDVVNN